MHTIVSAMRVQQDAHERSPAVLIMPPYCRDSMTQLLQNVGSGASLPYMFLPGNHEARAHAATCLSDGHGLTVIGGCC